MGFLKSQPALIIVDMQNGFCHESGTFGKLGMPVHRLMLIVGNINHLREAAHACGIKVIFLQMGWDETYSDSGLLVERLPQIKEMKGFIRGSWDVDIIDELKPDPSRGEIVVPKTRNTGFYHTNLEELLRGSGVDQVVVTGVGTNICVESTVRDAFTMDIDAVIVSDATATISDEEHEVSLKNMSWFGVVRSSAEVLDELKGRS